MNVRMLDNLNEAVDFGGKFAISGSLLIVTYNVVAKYFSLESINPLLLFITGIVSLLYMISKWRGQILANRHKRMEIEQMVVEREVLEDIRTKKKKKKS